jgi:hypothetical protein
MRGTLIREMIDMRRGGVLCECVFLSEHGFSRYHRHAIPKYMHF